MDKEESKQLNEYSSSFVKSENKQNGKKILRGRDDYVVILKAWRTTNEDMAMGGHSGSHKI